MDGFAQWHLVLRVYKRGIDYGFPAVFHSLLCSFQKVSLPSTTSHPPPAPTNSTHHPVMFCNGTPLRAHFFAVVSYFPRGFLVSAHLITLTFLTGISDKDFFILFSYFNSSLNIHPCATPICSKLHHLLLSAITRLKLTLQLPPLPHTHPACPLTPPTTSPSDLARIELANDVGDDSDLLVALDWQASPLRTMHLVSEFRCWHQCLVDLT